MKKLAEKFDMEYVGAVLVFLFGIPAALSLVILLTTAIPGVQPVADGVRQLLLWAIGVGVPGFIFGTFCMAYKGTTKQYSSKEEEINFLMTNAPDSLQKLDRMLDKNVIPKEQAERALRSIEHMCQMGTEMLQKHKAAFGAAS